MEPLIKQWMNEHPVSYIIGLKEPGHSKESLRSLGGPKMLPLHKQKPWEKKKWSNCWTKTKTWQFNENLTSYSWQLAFYLVEEVDDLGEDVQASPRVDGGLIKNTCLSTRRENKYFWFSYLFIFVYFIAV